jgi:lysophospholipid acyltransferase (LPLAT)-like uncharacterized protein
MIRVVAFIASVFTRCWMKFVRHRVMSLDDRTHPADPAQSRYVYCFWHDSLAGPLKIRAKVKILISQHADGELIAQVCERLGFGTIRGSTTRGGAEALLDMIRGNHQSSHLAVTPDGPRGPRHKLQPGVILVASLSELAIVPVGVGYTHAWRAKSWDRFIVPIPLSTIVGVLGEPIHIPPKLNRAGITHWQEYVERRLTTVNELAAEWAARIAQDGIDARPPDRASVLDRRNSA